jgi:hypothetical protein
LSFLLEGIARISQKWIGDDAPRKIEEGRTRADVLRQATRTSRVSQQEISRRTGIPAPVVSRFLARKRDRTLTTADKLAACPGLDLRSRNKAKSK